MSASETTRKTTTPQGAAAKAGVDALRAGKQVCFKRYHRVILPLDGFAFWVRADFLTGSSLLDVPFSLLNGKASTMPLEIKVPGYVHVQTDQQQNPDESFAFNRVIFTAEERVEPFEVVAPEMMWIGTQGRLRFSFDQRTMWSEEAGLWHYAGDAIYPVMETQIIDDPSQLMLDRVVVSNSIPIWLTLNSVAPVYPAYLLPDNLRPPYVSVEVRSTEGLASAPLLTPTDVVQGPGIGSFAVGQSAIGAGGVVNRVVHDQLSKDVVRIVTYGLRADEIAAFTDMVNQFTLDTEAMGILNIPVPYDEHRQQNELNVLAQKKSMAWEVSYVQSAVLETAVRFITSAVPRIFPQGSAAA